MIHGDRVHLKVRPEVSTLDFANGVLLQGFRIPALSTRRTETEVDLLDGQTFAIAGLINNSMNSTLQKIPGIGDIPILGLLFKSKAANKDQTELVVMITPQILARNSSGVTTRLPSTPEPFLAPLPAKKVVDPLPPAFTPNRASAVNPTAADAAPAGAASRSGGSDSRGTGCHVRAGHAVTRGCRRNSESAASARCRCSGEDRNLAGAGDGGSTPARREPTQCQRAACSRRHAAARPRRQAAEQEGAERRRTSSINGRRRPSRNCRTRPRVNRPRHDADAAKAAAEQAKRQARIDAEAAKVAAEKAKKQAEAERNHQKALDEAAAKAKEADARYQAELARNQK